MKFTIYTATCTGNENNTKYPNKVEINDLELLHTAIQFDHVMAMYKDNYRSNKNFISSNVLPMDIDNDHTTDPNEFITAEKLDEMFSDMNYVLVPSRHHMLPKGSKPAAPRYHIFFPINACTDAGVYVSLKVQLHSKYPFIDDNTLDAARFFFGSDPDADDIVWHEGWLNIDDELDITYRYKGDGKFEKVEDPEPASFSGTITEGSRNNTMSRFASRVLKRYGETEKAYEVFLERSGKCDPPLPEDELKTIWNSAVKFFKNTIAKAPDYVDAAEYDEDFDIESMKPDDYSDIGEAKVLVREYGMELRYSSATGYLRYDGSVWVEDEQVAIGAAEEFLDLQLADAKQKLSDAEQALIDAGLSEEVARTGSKNIAKVIDPGMSQQLMQLISAETYLKFVMRRRDYRYVVATCNVAKPMLGITITELDSDEFMLNTKTGTYDLRRGLDGFHPHRPEDFLTKITACGPDQEGKEIWDDALNTFFCGDEELIEYVQLVAGMAAIGKVNQEHIIIAYGSGANGKSTFWNTLFRVMGEYSGKLSAEALTMSNKRNVKPEMAELKGKRLIIASEMEEGMRLNTAMVKQLCSTDEIFAEKKYKAPFSFKPSHTLVLYTNHLPKVGASDEGIWRRLIVIPFQAHITGKSDIKNYADFLLQYAGGAILSWVIEGAKKAIDRDYHTPLPKVVQAAIEAYRETNDWMGQFINECCEVGDGHEAGSGELYQAYRSYCIRCNEYIRNTTDFYQEINKRGFFRRKVTKGYVINGIRLKEEADFEV